MNENLLTREYFNNNADSWENKQAEMDNKIRWLLSRSRLNPFQTILDIGCGTGVLFPFLKQMTNGKAKIFAIDFANRMAQTAAQYNERMINVVCGDIQKLPFCANKFHRIVAFHVFPHIHYKFLALKECWRVLKPEGELAIIHLHSSDEINTIHAELGGTVGNHKLPSGKQMVYLLQEVNFEVMETIDRSGEYLIKALKINKNGNRKC